MLYTDTVLIVLFIISNVHIKSVFSMCGHSKWRVLQMLCKCCLISEALWWEVFCACLHLVRKLRQGADGDRMGWGCPVLPVWALRSWRTVLEIIWKPGHLSPNRGPKRRKRSKQQKSTLRRRKRLRSPFPRRSRSPSPQSSLTQLS